MVKKVSNLLLFLLILGTVSTAFSQEISVSKGIRLQSRMPRFKILGQNGDGLIVRHFGKNVEQLDFYDDNLEFKSSKAVLIRRPDFQPISYLLRKHGASFFYSDLHKKELVLYGAQLNEKYESSPEISIDTIELDNPTVDTRIYSAASSNRGLILLYFPEIIGNRIKSVRIAALNNQMQQLYKLSIPIDSTLEQMDFMDALIDNRGNTFLLTRTGAHEPYMYHVYSYDPAAHEIWKMRLHLDHPMFGEPMFDIDEQNHKLIAGGLLSNGQSGNEEGSIGIFSYSLRLDSLQDERFYMLNYGDEFIKQLTGKEHGAEHDLLTFRPKRIIARSDGGAIILAESFIKDDEEYSAPSFGPGAGFSNFRSINLFYYRDVIITSVSPDGNIEWRSILRKNQSSQDDNGQYSSFALLNTNNRLHLFFLNEIYSRSTMRDFIQDPDGTNHGNEILSLEDKNIMPVPRMALQTAPREVVMPSVKDNEFKILKIAY